jgi:hypothetical protein
MAATAVAGGGVGKPSAEPDVIAFFFAEWL